MRRTLPFLIALLIISLLIGCSGKQSYKTSSFHMGARVEFNIPFEKNSIADARRICGLAESKIASLDRAFSMFDESSEVWKINNSADKSSLIVSPELFEITERAKEYYVLSQGAFDITVGPLVDLWGFGTKKRKSVDIREVGELMKHTGFDKVELDKKNLALIFKDPMVRIDLGGIAPGYAVDKIVQIFRDCGITKGIVNAGGEIYCLGTNAEGYDWSIGIKDPDSKNRILARLNIIDKGVATSGDYENCYISEGKKYSHIIDPRSGFAVANQIRSVTIIADDCITADALATAVFVLGETEGLALIEKIKDAECLLVVDKNGRPGIVMSNGMKKYLK